MKPKGNPIGWCDKTVNPVWGCPTGCEYCYARSINDRFKRIPDFSKPQFFPSALKEFRTKKPMIIFIDSMSDIAYWEVAWFRQTVFTMYNEGQNIYLALTKNIGKYKTEKQIEFPSMLRFFIGATVTNRAQARAVIDAGGADFISFEPLLERINYELLHKLRCKWWIIGDLTKNGKPQGATKWWWVEDMIERAWQYEIPIFMKNSLHGITKGYYLRQEFPGGWKV